MPPITRRPALLATVAASALLANALPAAAEIVGTAGAVNPASLSSAPGANVRVIEIGAKVVHKERIRTSDKGSVQLVFIDKTSISIGPNSDLLIDDFVFDPKTGTGRMAATLTKGALRFVGGNTSHTGGATITTPAATLGIRGGMNTTTHDPATGTFTIAHFGSTTVESPGFRDTLSRPDFGMSVGTNGQATAPRRVLPTEIARLASRLTSARGQSGGAPRRPTPELVARSGVGQTNATVPPSTPSVQGQTTASSSSSTEPEPTPESVEQQSGANQAVQTGTQSQATQETAHQYEPPPSDHHTPPPAHSPPPRRFYAMNMSVDPSLNAGAPYLHPNFVAPTGTFYNSPVVGFGPGGTFSDGTPVTGTRFMQAGLNITGSGTSQVSTIYVASGSTDISQNNGQPYFAGGFSASTRRAANSSAGVSTGPIAGIGSGVVFDSTYTPVSAQVDSEILDSTDTLQPGHAFYYQGGGGSSANYEFSQEATRTTNPVGLGSERPRVMLSGYAAGIGRTVAISTNAQIAPSYRFDGVITADMGVTNLNRMGVRIVGGNLAPATSNSNELRTADYYFGSHGSTTGGSRGAYVDYDYFGARESRRLADNSFLNTTNEQSTSYGIASMVNSKAVRAESLGVAGKSLAPTTGGATTFCACEYTRWGFWSSNVGRAAGTDTYEDRFHLATWVMGLPSNPASLPTAGIAKFSGHVIASLRTSNTEYVAAGNLTNTVNFGTRQGTVAISGLDNHSYSGTVSYSSGSNQFAGTLAGVGPNNPAMAMKGQFFDGRLGPAREMGGSVQINGTNYIGSGTFAARR